MTIGVIARLKIQEGKNEEFESIFGELAKQVRENEEGNIFYSLHLSKGSTTDYVVLEQYTDQAALDAHGQTAYFKELGAKLGPCMAGRPDVEYLDCKD